MADQITVTTQINAPIQKVWDCYTNPEHIVQWNSAGDGWHTPKAENDLQVGGKFLSRMEPEADPAGGFDFTGTYTAVEEHRLIQYSTDDGRVVTVTFNETEPGTTNVEVVFDAETENSLEMQQEGWQAILTNFKIYTEALGR